MAKAIRGTLHDFNARNDPKIRQLRSEHGLEAYGLYWCLIEILRGYENLTIPNNHIKGVAHDCDLTVKKLQKYLDTMIELELLAVNANGYFSPSLTRRINAYRRKSKEEISENLDENLENSSENLKNSEKKLPKLEEEFNHSNDIQSYSGIQTHESSKCIYISSYNKELNNNSELQTNSKNLDSDQVNILEILKPQTVEALKLVYLSAGLNELDFQSACIDCGVYLAGDATKPRTDKKINLYMRNHIFNNAIEKRIKLNNLTRSSGEDTRGLDLIREAQKLQELEKNGGKFQ